MKNYPIAIFCYNRPDHLKKLFSSILKSENYKKFKFYFFCDGSKENILDKKKCFSVLKLVKKFNGKKKIIIRNKNLGLSKNIISGLNYLFKEKKYKAAIVIEDDLEIGFNSLTFLNDSLTFHKTNTKIGSVTAYSYVNNSKKLKSINNFLTYRHCSWCWGTWSRVWNKINWSNYTLSKFKRRKFTDGGFDLPIMLKAQKLKLINSWAIRFNLFCYNNNLLSLAPRYSIIKNEILSGYKPKVKNPKKYVYFNKYIKFTNFISIRLMFKIFLKNIFK